MTDNRTHRDLPSILTDPAERQRQIKWLRAHPAWTHPITIRIPPDGYEPDPLPKKPSYSFEEVFGDSSKWPEQVISDGDWSECIDISVVYVNPETEEIDFEDETKNTALRVWLEAGPWYDRSTDSCIQPDEGWNDHNRWMGSHDTNLDCGAPDIETALLEMARLVKFFYGEGKDHRADAPVHCEGHFEKLLEKDEKYIPGCKDAGDGFCSVCGFNIRD